VCSRARSGERIEREHDVTAGQLGFFAYNMLQFSVPEDRCVAPRHCATVCARIAA